MWSQLLPWLLLAGCVIAVNSAAAMLIFRLSARIRGLTSELEVAQTERAQLEHGRIGLEADLASRARELEDLERRSREVAERTADPELERQLEAQSALAARVPGLETRLAERERELGERTGELEAATHARHELEQRVERRTSELAELERKAGDLEAELRARQGEVAETRRGLEEHQAELERERRASEDREHELALRLQEREARAAELVGELARREDDLGRRSETAELLEVELDEARRRIDALRDELEAERRARTERERELERRVEEREATLSTRAEALEEELRRRSETLETLQEELAEERRRTSDVTDRREELEGRERSSAERERELARRLHDLQAALGGRTGELEAALAEREAELRRRSESIESLRAEVVEARSRLDALAGQRDELERQGLAQAEREQALRARVEEIESVVSARIDELEEGLADRDDALAQRSATIAELLAEIARGAATLEAVRRRSDELTSENQRRLQVEQERVALAQEGERRASQIATELESRFFARDQELARLRGECVELAGRCGGLSERVDARERDLRDRDRSLSGAQARLAELASEVQRRRERFEADQLEIERLVEGRILGLFEPQDTKGEEPLSEPYLAGLAAGDLELAVRGLLGGEEPLSAEALASLCERWRDGYAAWRVAPIERHVEYLWADGIRVRAGVAGEHSLLVAVACYGDGETSPIAFEAGDARAKDDWLALLQHLERRGMNVPRMVVTGETTGAPAALEELGWTSVVQNCWNGRMAAVLAELPGSRHAAASKALRALSLAKTRAKAKQLRERFVKRCGKRHAAAGERVGTQWRRMTSFHAFPEEHHQHLRTTELVGAPFARIRLLAAVSEPSPVSSPQLSHGTAEIDAILWRLASLAHGVFPRVTPAPVPSAEKPRAVRALARAA